jgi:hypothetical protein
MHKIIRAIICPKLEYANIIWPPSTAADHKLIESVLRKATKWGRLKHLPYEVRLRVLNLSTLSARRNRQDCIQLYKHFSSEQSIAWVNPPFIPARQTRGHSLKYAGESATHHTYPPRYNFILNRANRLWNSLPESVVKASSVNVFKREYDTFMKSCPV